MFGLGKKEEIKKTAKEDVPADAGYADNIVVHVMPARFLHSHESAAKATKSGILILVSGVIILVTMLILAYFFVFKSQPKENAPLGDESAGAPETAETPVPIKPEPAKEEIRPSEEEIVTDTEEEPVPDAGEGIGTTTEPAATGTEPAVIDFTAPETPPVFLPATDSDSDGLFDQEEAVFGTDINNQDSDSDTFGDLAEILKFYNPAGAGKLTANPNIETYLNPTFSYRLYYPKEWAISTFGGDDSVMFTIGNNQFIQAIVQPNSEKKPITDWYEAQFGAAQYSPSRVLNGEGWTGVLSADNTIIYLTDEKREYLVTMTYNLGPANTAYYGNVFQLMINSLIFNAGSN